MGPGCGHFSLMMHFLLRLVWAHAARAGPIMMAELVNSAPSVNGTGHTGPKILLTMV